MPTEAQYQSQLIMRIKLRLPGCEVLKQDSGYRQGIPDLIVLYGNRWGMLEVKLSARSRRQPNQDFYVEKYGEMSFAAFIYPEIEEEVLDDLQRSLETRRHSRVPVRQ